MLNCSSAYFLLAVLNLSSHGVYNRIGDDEAKQFKVPDSPVRTIGNKVHIPGLLPVARR